MNVFVDFSQFEIDYKAFRNHPYQHCRKVRSISMENIEYVRPQDIEKRSFAIISKELEEKGIVLPKEQELVTKRAQILIMQRP